MAATATAYRLQVVDALEPQPVTPLLRLGRRSLLNPKQGDDELPALLLVLLLILVLFVLGFAVVKFLIWVAIILAIIWLIGFFVRGVEGARWYRW